MSPLTSSTMDLLKFGLVSDQLDDFALRDLADFSLRPRLLAVPGVARVTVFGGAVRQLQVQIDPQRLRASGLGMSELLAVMRSALAPHGGGLLRSEEHTSELQSLMRISYAVFCLKKNKKNN